MRALPWLVADIGGTNMRLGRILQAGGDVQDIARFDTPRSGDLAPVLKPYLDRFSEGRPRTAALAVAGPIVARPDTDCRVQLTNSGAHLTQGEAERLLGLDAIVLVNDLAAVAASLPRLTGGEVRALGPDLDVPREGTRVVLGCGTGCGVGAAVWTGEHWHVAASEGGHLPFPPRSDRERRWHAHIAARLPLEAEARVTYDRVLCGSGLQALVEVIAAEANRTAPATPEAIVAASRTGSDPDCVAAATLFAEWVGTAAGDLAQVFMARGGIYLAGSLLEGLEPYLAAPAVRRAFTAKWPHASVLETIPMKLIVDPKAALIGLGECLARAQTRPPD